MANYFQHDIINNGDQKQITFIRNPQLPYPKILIIKHKTQNSRTHKAGKHPKKWLTNNNKKGAIQINGRPFLILINLRLFRLVEAQIVDIGVEHKSGLGMVVGLSTFDKDVGGGLEALFALGVEQ